MLSDEFFFKKNLHRQFRLREPFPTELPRLAPWARFYEPPMVLVKRLSDGDFDSMAVMTNTANFLDSDEAEDENYLKGIWESLIDEHNAWQARLHLAEVGNPTGRPS